jgi:hypothetical protein
MRLAGRFRLSTNSPITKKHWTADALAVSGTLTNSSAIAVKITGIDTIGFDVRQNKCIAPKNHLTMAVSVGRMVESASLFTTLLQKDSVNEP